MKHEFEVNGFKLMDTGGGHTALRKFLKDGKIVQVTNEDLQVPKKGETCFLEIVGADGDSVGQSRLSYEDAFVLIRHWID